jgi:Flp pilus assembly protein TadB
MTKAVGSGDWAKAVNPRRHAASLPLVIGAVAVGGALVYFLTPVEGAERRQRVLSAWRENGHATMEAGRRAARQTAEAVKPVVSRVSDGVADAVEDVKVMVSWRATLRTVEQPEVGTKVIHFLIVAAVVLFILWLLFHAAGGLINLILIAVVVLAVIWLVGLFRSRRT